MKIGFRCGAIFLRTVLFLAALCSCAGNKTQSPITAFSGSFVQQGRQVADLANYRIAYYEPVEGGGDYSGSIAESDDPFTVVDYGPRDELPQEIKRPSIYVIFSQPVVPLAKLGEPIREDAGLFEIEPPLAGVYRWYGSKLLSFEPDADSMPQQRYTITVSEGITSLGGKALEGEHSFSFETERLSVLNWQLGDGERYVNNRNTHPQDAQIIRLIFSYPVNLDEIANWIEVRAAGRTWPFTLARLPTIDERRYRAEQGVLVSIGGNLPRDTDVVMELKEGARSEPDWLGTKEAKTWSYHTLLPFRFERASARGYSRPRSREGDSIPISLEFSQNVEADGAERHFSVAGLPALKKENVNVIGSTVVINGLPLEYEKTYTVRIAAGLKDLFGRTLGSAVQAEVNTGEAESYVYIHNQGSRMMEAGFPPQITWEAQNPVSLRRLVAPAQGPYERLPLDGLAEVDLSRRYFMEDLSPFLNAAGKGSATLRWQYQFRPSWQRDSVHSADAWLTVQVTNLGITLRYGYNTVLVWATHLSDGTAAANAGVELLEGGQVVISGTTDGQGLAVFEFPNGDFVSRFTDPTERLFDDNPFGKGLRIRVTEGEGDTRDQAEFVPNNSHNIWYSITARTSPFTAERDRAVVFLFTDRGLYRPGETVTFRGVDRRLSRGEYSAYRGRYSIEVLAASRQVAAITSLEGATTANGGSSGSFTLPANLDPGRYRIAYRRTGPAGREGSSSPETSITFTVANFDRLRFETSLRFPDLLVYQGERISASLSASYLAGGGLSGAPFTWHLTREPASFVPGSVSSAGNTWDNWRFGPELNGWPERIDRGEGNLGPNGTAAITSETRQFVPDQPLVTSSEIQGNGIEGAAYRYRLEASVQDAARQEVASRADILVHPASFYIAARLDPGTLRAAIVPGASGNRNIPGPSAYFLNAGNPATLQWALVAPNGNAPSSGVPVGGELSIQLIRHEWKQPRRVEPSGSPIWHWEQVEEIVEQRSVRIDPKSSGFVSGVFNFTPDRSGLWELRLRNDDTRERVAVTSLRFYVSGSGLVHWGFDTAEAISLSTERQSYAPGDTARILVRSPLEKGSYLLTLEREGIISHRIIELDGSARTIDIPVEESFIPVVYATLSSYTVRPGQSENTDNNFDPDKPRGIFGVTPMYVDHASRSYQIEIESPVAYRPAEQAEITVKVMLNGRPAANTELIFMAVDRGVLDLIDYHVPDPAAFFYDARNFPLGIRGADSRSLLIDQVRRNLPETPGLAFQDSGIRARTSASEETRWEGTGFNGAGADGNEPWLQERTDFRPMAVFEPNLATGPDGTATVRFTLPDSLTTYRLTAIAVGQRDFGIKEQDLRVSAPLTAITALPRKLRWRDTGTVSLILTNLENTSVEAQVSLETSVIEVDGESATTVRIAPGASEEVTFRVAALETGVAQLTFTLRSPQVNERIVRTLLVDRPSLTETVTTIGTLAAGDGFIEEGMVLPSLVPEGTGRVTVHLSASRLAMLETAFRYLLDYPFDCIEQRSARLLPLIAFGDHLDAFGLTGPLGDIDNPRQLVEDGLAEIAKSQLSDGSFPYWPGGRQGDIFASLRLAHIIVLARAKGMAVPLSLDTQRLLAYIGSVSTNPEHYLASDPFLKGYSLWVRAMHGERISSEISAFLTQGDELGISGWAFAGLAALELGQRDMAASTMDRVRRFIRPGTRSLDLTDTYERRGNYWGYDSDRYALALMLFQSLSPSDDMADRLITSLIARQRSGVWNNTASSFWAVLALGMVADTEAAGWETSEGPTAAEISLGGESLVSAEFAGYGGASVSYNGAFAETPLASLARDTLLPLRIERAPLAEGGGAGGLYYTASLRYGIPTELAGPRDEGLGVFVETFDSDGNAVTDGRLKSGSTYTRRITVSTSRDRTYVALRAPIPSGAEIIDSTFVTSSTVPPSEEGAGEPSSRQRYGDRSRYQPQPLRFIMDDEARFHWDFFRAGRQQVEFRFRAVMPGIYPTPPATAECMYEEEIFGRSAGELVRIQ